MEQNEKIKYVRGMFNEDLKDVNNLIVLNEIKVKYLGKKGITQDLFKVMKVLDKKEKKEYGFLLNELMREINQSLTTLKEELELKELEMKLTQEKIDVTLPGINITTGAPHPMSKIIDEISELFIAMGYDVISGPEMESDLYNFEYLNVPKHHPARDMQDTFYITEEMLLRTQTSPAQVRTLLGNKEKGPVRVICPGRVYRRDNDDATHSHQFAQIEGLVVDKNISMAHLKGTLEIFAKKLFGSDREIRFRPSYFPFTEPSIEVDVNCFNCNGNGCAICKQSGWIEILGAGMVHPHVLKMCGYDSEVWTGFAFGMGVERIAMLKYGIPDIRDFYTNDLRFVKQFDQFEGGE